MLIKGNHIDGSFFCNYLIAFLKCSGTDTPMKNFNIVLAEGNIYDWAELEEQGLIYTHIGE